MTRFNCPSGCLLAVAVAVALAVFGPNATAGRAQTPTESPVQSPAASAAPASATPSPSPTSEPRKDFQLTVTLKSEIVDGRQQQIADGAELVARSAELICAHAPIDAKTLNSGSAVTTVLTIPPAGGCGEPGIVLSIEILFPGESRGGFLNFSTVWEEGVSRSVDLIIPAPVPIPSAPEQLPGTGSTGDVGDSSSSGWAIALAVTLIVIGGGAGAVLLGRRDDR